MPDESIGVEGVRITKNQPLSSFQRAKLRDRKSVLGKAYEEKRKRLDTRKAERADAKTKLRKKPVRARSRYSQKIISKRG